MSLLFESKLHQPPPESEPADGKECWEYLACHREFCPAYGRRNTPCWLVPRTRCSDSPSNDFFQKLPTCLACAHFQERAKRHPGGFNYFLAEQVQKNNIHALEHIYQKEESFVDILNRIPDGLFTTDQELRITYFNPAAEKITGFSASDAVGMYCKDVFKNSICETGCALKRAAAQWGDIHNQESTITDINGRKIPVICSTSAFRNGSGRITGGLEIFKDITELKQLHEEIASRERKYRRIFEGSHDMIYTSNQEGKILDVNRAGVEMLGYRSKSELLSLGSVERLYRRDDDRQKFIKAINREGFVKDFEVDFKGRDASPIHVLISSRRYENPLNGDIEYEGIIKDITQRKLAEEIIKQRNSELSVLNSVAVALNISSDLNHILMVTLKHLLKVLRLDRGAIFLIDRENKRARLQIRYGLPEEEPALKDDIIFKDTLLMKHLLEVAELTPKPTFPAFQVSYRARKSDYVPWLTCFLISSKEKAAGFFGFELPPGRVLSQQEIHLLGSLGNFIGGGIENAQLMKTIRLNQQELKRLTENLFRTLEEERRRIARELHDEAGQALTAVKLGLDRLEEKVSSREDQAKQEVDEIRRTLVRTSAEIRRLSYRLHPTLLSDLGLEPALRLYFKDMMSRSNLDIQFRMVGFDQRLDADTETGLYRFSQETLTNAVKHSGAEHFRLSIIKSYPKIIFLAEDDGVGFDSQSLGSDERGLGLIGMRERAYLLGGTFQLRSTKGEGTRIRIEIPLAEAQRNESTH